MTRRDELGELNEYLKAQMALAEPKEAAGLVRERRAVLKELDELSGTSEVDLVDELLARREARETDARPSVPARRRSQQRRRGSGAAPDAR